MPSYRVTVGSSVEVDTVETIDRLAEKANQTRSAYIRSVLEAHAKRSSIPTPGSFHYTGREVL